MAGCGVLAAVISNCTSHVVGFSFIIPSASAGTAANRLLLRANAAQQRHNVAFVLDDGAFEGGAAVPEGGRVGGMHEKNTTQNQ